MMHYFNDHIEDFAQIMSARGYGSHFLCNAAHPGKLRESLVKHVVESLQGDTHLHPFFLTTYTNWKDNKSPYVRCDFKIKYSQSEGFFAEKLDITHGTYAGKIKSVSLSLKGNKDIPYREHANNLVMGRQKKLKVGLMQITLLLTITLCYSMAIAQSPNWNEWFRQKKTQRKYLTQQIAALKVYAEYVKQGYDIAQKGLTAIEGITNGTFTLDKNYLNALKTVSPVVKNSPKVNDIIHYQQRIIGELRKLRDQVKENRHFTTDEITYIEAVCQNMLSEYSHSVDELTLVTTTGEAEMTDDERMLRLDKVHRDMQDVYAFTQYFIGSTIQLSLQRQEEAKQISETTRLHN